MKIKSGRKFKDKYGHIKVEVLFANEAGVLYKLSENGFISVVSTEAFLETFKPITTHKVFRVWKLLEDDTMTNKQKAICILQEWPQKSDGRTIEELYNVGTIPPLSNDWFVEEEVDEWWWTKEGTK